MSNISFATISSLAEDLGLEVEVDRLTDMAAELSHLFSKMEQMDLPATAEPAFRFAPCSEADSR